MHLKLANVNQKAKLRPIDKNGNAFTPLREFGCLIPILHTKILKRKEEAAPCLGAESGEPGLELVSV